MLGVILVTVGTIAAHPNVNNMMSLTIGVQLACEEIFGGIVNEIFLQTPFAVLLVTLASQTFHAVTMSKTTTGVTQLMVTGNIAAQVNVASIVPKTAMTGVRLGKNGVNVKYENFHTLIIHTTESNVTLITSVATMEKIMLGATLHGHGLIL